MEDTRMKKHVTVVGAIHIGFWNFGADRCSCSFFRTEFCQADGRWRWGRYDGIEVPFIESAASYRFYVDPWSCGGIGLLSFQPWARYLVIVVAALGCLNIPIGTLKGVYSLWVLLQDDTIKLFNPTREGWNPCKDQNKMVNYFKSKIILTAKGPKF